MPKPPRIQSFLANIPATLPEEVFETWLETPAFRLERILSRGHTSPEDTWYDQALDEWVMLLQGLARLQMEDEVEPIDLQPGDTLLIPAHCRHRVSWTDPEQDTVWVALHFASTQTEQPAKG
jgi:cupin 2 domain-containing protein